MRMQLNNKNLFHYGPLDQGWWPDDCILPRQMKALLYDIIKTKEWGFNMIRKHVKVEPARWYSHCDREGILVWQDMPSGDMARNRWEYWTYNARKQTNPVRKSLSPNYYQEWKKIMDLCHI